MTEESAPDSLTRAWNWVFGPKGPRYRHTCFVYAPLRFSSSNLPFIGYLPQRDDLQGSTIGQYWATSRSVIEKRLLTTKHMAMLDFCNVLSDAIDDVRDNRVVDVSMQAYAVQLLLAFDSAGRNPGLEVCREMSEIYIVTIENRFPDDLMEPGDTGGGCQPM